MLNMTNDLLEPRGQALLEFLGSSILAVIVIAGASFMLLDQWHRGKCAYLVFENTHLRLLGIQVNLLPVIQIEENEQGFLAVGRCGRMTEKVRLPKLEAAIW